MSQVSAKRYKENNWRKGSRGRTELAVQLKTISTAVLAWMVIAQLHLPVNSAKSVLGMHHQTDEQSSRSEKWLKFSGDVEYAWRLVKNASGRRAAELFMETTEEHKVLRPIKRAKIHNSHRVTEKSPSHGKNWSNRASWRACTKIRDAPAEKTWTTRTERLFLWCFSAPYWEKILASSGAHCTIFKPYYAFKRMELITPTKRG